MELGKIGWEGVLTGFIWLRIRTSDEEFLHQLNNKGSA
jgi:hypothetical protein